MLCDCSSRQCSSNPSPAMFSVLVWKLSNHECDLCLLINQCGFFFTKFVGCGLHTGVIYLQSRIYSTQRQGRRADRDQNYLDSNKEQRKYSCKQLHDYGSPTEQILKTLNSGHFIVFTCRLVKRITAGPVQRRCQS